MCRWITLISSKKVSLSDVILAPSQSLVQMSRDASFHPGAVNLNNSLMNGDGFGVGWYHNNAAIVHEKTVTMDGGKDSPKKLITNKQEAMNGDHQPTRAAAIYKDVFPAWNNLNLREICLSTASDCIMAHVRAASAGSGISFTNCHPFKAGRLIFCHNGRLEKFQTWRRKLMELVDDEAFAIVKGTTDSEAIFALIITNLNKDGLGSGSPIQQKTGFGEKRLVEAIKKAIHQINHVFSTVGIEGYNTCNFSLTDGNTMVVTRYCDKAPDVPPPSLYFAFGDATILHQELTNEPSPEAPLFTTQESRADTSGHGSAMETVSVESDPEDDDSFEEREVLLYDKESRPGTVMKEVNAKDASFIVASNPLTKTHNWHKLPQNCIMWCTRGENPELRLLKRRSGSSMVIHSLK